MLSIKSLLLISALLISSLTVHPTSTAWAEDLCEKWIGKIVSVQGIVQAQRVNQDYWKPVHFNDTYCDGDMIRVQKQSRAAVVLSNGATLRIDQNSTITFSRLEKKKTLLLKLLNGAAHFFSRIPRSLKLETPFVNGGVEGTEFYVKVEQDQTYLLVFEGKVLATNETGSLPITSGQSALAKKGKAPELRVVARPRDAVQWALYYPPVIYAPPEETPVKDDTNDPRFLTRRASLLLSVGRVDEANADIEQVSKLSPNYSDSFALQSIIAVVQNEKEKALELSERAVRLDPNSATARIALSYAQQAKFDLKGARESLEAAVKLEPENALAWARLAELWSSFGDLDNSLKAAKKASALDPNLSRTQTVLGFAYLIQVMTTESKDAFEKAIDLDQAEPLPRLGLGLAKIRDGDLKEGRAEIEIAVSLNPNNSLFRSYLGKAYYEEKRTNLDEREYAVAKKLDPMDPTPWFYDAIRKHTVNCPVEALQDLQKAIELNNNRAVYRSRLLLDSDLAARSSSLARIYNNLGFQQLGLVEGYKSINTDPSDFSAHRFLADSYAALPRHEIARVSELLQSQLLQPINITPIQTQRAEGKLKILEGAGPSDPSFNEFNPLFNRDRFALQASSVVGGNDTLGDELVFSGIYGNGSFSIGQFHFESDGFRENNDQEKEIYNAFAQLSLTHKTSMQVEYRYRDNENGDLSLLFHADDLGDDQREKENTESIRLGLRHNFGTQSNLLASFIYSEADFDTVWSPGSKSTSDLEGYIAETQHLIRSEIFQVVSGIGYFDSDRKDMDIIAPWPIWVDETEARHTNLYVYSLINYPKNAIWTLGGSADFFEGGFLDLDDDQFNPKFGLIWNPFPTTTLRAAAFRTFKRSLIANQTLEPTQVAGFNQFFDDGTGADVWRYGIGIDQKLTSRLYAGAEGSKRDLKEKARVPPDFTIEEFDLDEYLFRAYTYWAPFSWLALSPEYQFERFKRPIEFTGEEMITELDTHQFSLGINFYHRNGFGALLKPIYVEQNGEFLVHPFVDVASGEDHFWIVDASIWYRLPRRWGRVTIEVRNLFDENFRFQDTDPSNPAIYPESLIIAKFTLSF